MLLPLDVAAAISAAACEDCRPQLAQVYAGRAALCERCEAVRAEVVERLRTGVHPDALRTLAAKVLAARSGSGAAKRRGGRTKREVSEYMRALIAKRWNKRKPTP